MQEDVNIFTKKDISSENITSEVELNNNLRAPIKEGTIVGKVIYTSGDINYEYNLVAESDVKYNYLLVGVCILGVILVGIFFVKIAFK